MKYFILVSLYAITISLVLFGTKTVVLNPSWFYVFQVVVLLIALFWDDEQEVEAMRHESTKHVN